MRCVYCIPLSLLIFSPAVLGADNPIPNPSFEKLDNAGWAASWGRYNWGMEGSDGTQKVDTSVAHSGKNSIMGINRTAAARAGAYAHVPLPAGSWELSFWAKAAPGETGAVRCYLGSAYSRSFSIGDQWTPIRYRHTLLSPVERAEINIQNSSGKVGTIWFDDVALAPAKASEFQIAKDSRPASKQPKLVYFDAHLMHWADHAAEWKARGFSGAFISGIFGDIHDDPWAADGDPATRGEDDKLLQECRAANEKCLKAGIDSNILKVAFYADLPDPWDDGGYRKITNNFREAARFARLAGFLCIAIDTEYTAYQFDPVWKGYNRTKHSVAELAAKLRERWKGITAAMASEYSDVDLLVLPEGSIYYGPLWNDIFAGMIEGLMAAKHKQGIHLFCEGSYTVRDPEALSEHALDVRETTGRNMPPGPREYWLKSGSVALGTWPLGYYRAITDAKGKFLGWSGRKEVFGDKIVGSYADKSENFPLTEFRIQMAAVRSFSGKYCWIYGHGSSWWRMSPEENKLYKARSLQHYDSENYLLPTAPNIAEYYKIAAEHEMIVSPAAPNESPFADAKWIAPPAVASASGPAPLVRKEFTVSAKPSKAPLRIVGLGDYDARINGLRVADTGINQPWSQYEKTLYYRDFDITAQLAPGMNCVGVMFGNSFWHNPNPPQGRYNKDGPQRTASEPLVLCAEIVIEEADGSVRRIGTDASWRTSDGPIVFSHIYAGEDYDARRHKPGWDRAGFDDRAWNAARVAAAPAARLEAQHWPPVKAHERFSPVSIKQAAPGVFLYSFPQNCSAQLRIELAGGKPGDRVALRCGEHKSPQDRLFGGYVVGCELVTDGRPLDCQWTFFYLGMQFVEVAGTVPEGYANPDNRPVIGRMELAHVRTALPEVGSFQCSSDLYNRTHRLIDWAIRSNMSHVLTDCPHREKLGWLECSYLLAPSFFYRYDCRDWIAKVTRDIRDAQEPSGRVLTVAPSYPAGRFPGAFQWTVEWGAAAVLLPWRHYEWYGDPKILRDNFDAMRRFTDYIQTEAKDGLAPVGLGDWYDYGHGQAPGPSRYTPTQLSATATWALCALTVSRAAEVLGLPEEARKYRDLHARIASDFQRHFRDPVTGRLRHLGSPQCANAMALCTEVVPKGDRTALVEEIVADLKNRGWQQTPGDVGHVYFIRALAEAGRSDALHRVYSRDGVGSYGGILKKGLTALPETWDAMMDGSQSLDHCMLGHVIEWYYGYVAGIRQAPGSVGWKKILIGPNPGALTHAEATLQTPMGGVASRWRIDHGRFQLKTEIPAGVAATAILPSGRTRTLNSGLQEIDDTMP